MNATKTNERTSNFKEGLKKFGSVLLKILIGIAVAAVVIFALVAIYKIIEFLFVAAILLIGFAGVGPRRWWW